jgi:hypothetical protein
VVYVQSAIVPLRLSTPMEGLAVRPRYARLSKAMKEASPVVCETSATQSPVLAKPVPLQATDCSGCDWTIAFTDCGSTSNNEGNIVMCERGYRDFSPESCQGIPPYGAQNLYPSGHPCHQLACLLDRICHNPQCTCGI